jgi:hypothetical protein
MKFIIFGILLLIVLGWMIAMPAITINSNAVITSNAYSYIRAACYFLPLGTVTTILGLIVGLWGVRITVAFIKMVWDLLPVA